MPIYCLFHLQMTYICPEMAYICLNIGIITYISHQKSANLHQKGKGMYLFKYVGIPQLGEKHVY